MTAAANEQKTKKKAEKAALKATRERWFDAAYLGHAQILRELCGAIDPNLIRSKEEGLTAVMLALEHSRTEAVEFLATVSNMTLLSADGRDMLMHAAMGRCEKGAKLALPFCDAKRADDLGITALMMAAYHGHSDVVRLILPVSDPAAKTPEGRIALHFALEGVTSDSEEHVETLRALLPVSDWTARDPKGQTPLAMAMGHRVPVPKMVDELACLQPKSRASEQALEQWGAQKLPKLFAAAERLAISGAIKSGAAENVRKEQNAPIAPQSAMARDNAEKSAKTIAAKGPSRL